MPLSKLLCYSPPLRGLLRSPGLRNGAYPTAVRLLSDSKGSGKHKGLPGHNDEYQGTFARTDKEVVIEHPPEERLPQSIPFRGRGGTHDRRTLASFSLEDRVAVVTGGARGLGLVMAQALVISGASVALVDLNSELCKRDVTLRDSPMADARVN